MANMTPAEVIKNINGDLFKRQRALIGQMIRRAGDEGNEKEEELLIGLENFLDTIADIAHDDYGVDDEVAAALEEVLELFEWSTSGGAEEAAYDRGIAALQRRNAKKEVRDGS